MIARFALTLSLVGLPLGAAAQDEVSAEALAVRMASPGVIDAGQAGEYTAIELELQGCRVVQGLMTNQAIGMGGSFGVQVLRMDLRDLDPLTGILPGEDTANGDRRVMLVPSQAAWNEIQAAGQVFSDRRVAASEAGDQEDINGPNGARTLRTAAHRQFSAEAIAGEHGAVMARTHVMQMRGDRGALIYPLIAPMQITLNPEHAEAALEALESLRAGPCAPEGGGAMAPQVEGEASDPEAEPEAETETPADE